MMVFTWGCAMQSEAKLIPLTTAAFGALVSSVLAFPSAAELTFSDGGSRSGSMVVDVADGLINGANLLHSFEVFHVRTGESATFTGPDTIANIIARVTGSEGSEISGLLRSEIISANLFLLNPNGIVVGEGAAIEVDGSVHLASATSLLFEDGSSLMVAGSGASGFTSSPPSAFGFDSSPADIAFIRASLDPAATTPSNFSALQVVGGDLQIDESRLVLDGGDFTLVSTSEAAVVPVSGLPATGTGGDITIGGASLIETSASPAGAISISGGSLSVTDAAAIFADNTGDSPGAGINIQLSGTLNLTSAGRITTDALGTGDAANLFITAGDIVLTGTDTRVTSENRSTQGRGGDVTLMTGNLTVADGAQVRALTQSAGDAGSLTITANSVTVESGGVIDGRTRGSGNGGSVRVNATNSIVVDGLNSTISSATLTSAGNAGEVVISTPSLVLTDRATISAESATPFAGAPGSISINVRNLSITGESLVTTSNASFSAEGGAISVTADTVTIAGASATQPDLLFSGITSRTSGDFAGGDIVINAGTITLAEGATLEAVTESFGDAGSISVNGALNLSGARIDARTLGEGAGGQITLTGDITLAAGSAIETSSPDDFTGVGSAGEIRITGDRLDLSGGSSVASSTGGRGNAGNIRINSSNVAVNSGSSIDTTTQAPGPLAGTAGSIELVAETLHIDGEGSRVTSSTSGTATGGTILITADRVTLANGGSAEVAATGAGNAGDIHLSTNQLDISGGDIETSAALSGGGSLFIDVRDQLLLFDGTITASSGGPEAGDDGGNVTLGVPGAENPTLLLIRSGSIVAQAVQGNGGIINLYAGDLVADIHTVISATSELGNDGEVTITSPDNGVAGVVAALAPRLSGDQALLDDSCATRALGDRSSLLVPAVGLISGNAVTGGDASGSTRLAPAPDDYAAQSNSRCAPDSTGP